MIGNQEPPVSIGEILKGYQLKAARETAKELGLDQLVDAVLQSPAAIRRQKDAVRAAQEAVETTRRMVDEAEAFLRVAISQETNGDGKPAFSNEKAREAELIRRKGQDSDYQRALQELRQAEAALFEARAELERMEDEFKARRVALEATGNLLRVI